MAKDAFSFVALNQSMDFLGPKEYDPEQFVGVLNEDYEYEPAWEAAGIVAVVETIEDRDTQRLHVPKELAFDFKAEMRDSLADRLGFESGTFPLVEQPPRAALCDVYTFERDEEANWIPGEVPTFRSVMGSSDDLSTRIASRYINYCYGLGDCEDYDGYYPDFSEFAYQQFHLMGS